MIPDILFEAAEQLKTYQTDLLEVYPSIDMKSMIDATVGVMDALREYFDAPLSDTEEGEAAQQAAFWKRLAEIAKGHHQ